MKDEKAYADALRERIHVLPVFDIPLENVQESAQRRRVRTIAGALGAVAIAGAVAVPAINVALRDDIPPASTIRSEVPLALYPRGDSSAGDGASLVGALTLEQNCLYVVDEVGNRYILALPDGFARWDADTLIIDGGSIGLGETVTVGGGVAPPDVVDIAVPAGCDPKAEVWRGYTLVSILP